MHFYTSVNINYLPKARILAQTVKQYCANSTFSLVLSDQVPEGFDIEKESFDEIITVEQLGIPVENLNMWIYEHTVVELCTAVKGQALVKFLEAGYEKVVYLDPDIAVFDSLECLSDLLEEYSVVLTPHLTAPEKSSQGIVENELCTLQHGSFNFGFYALKKDDAGKDFAYWWRDRLLEYCYDNIPMGVFTDQKWGDLVPCIFDNVYIWRDPGCNVATWNISNREIKKVNGQFLVNGSPLKFYHFSGFDSGAQERMLKRYGNDNECLYELREWYIQKQIDAEQELYCQYPSKYNYYENGEKITIEERRLIRDRKDVRDFYKEINPYVIDQEKSYYYWYKNEMQNKLVFKNNIKIIIKKLKRKFKF